MDYRIDAMHCGGCVRGVRATVAQADPQAQVEVDLDSHRVSIDSSRPEAVLAALAEAGFPAVPA